MFTEKVPIYAAKMTIDAWLKNIGDGGFIDYDGFGHPVKDDKMDGDVLLLPSRGARNVPEGTTHVAWFNR